MPNTDEIFDYVMNSPENTNPAVLRGMLNSIEGGGGGLPSYTNEDIGKTLTLTASGKPTTETIVTIEEQTVSVSAKRGKASIKIAGKPLWQVGEAVHLTLNGTLYECVVEESLVHTVGIKVMTDVGQVIIDFNNKVLIYAGDATFTVSATIDAQAPSAAPTWENGALVVKLTTLDNSNFTADKTMGEIIEAAESGSVVFTRDMTDPSMPGMVATQISQIVQILETGQAYGLYVAMPVVNLSQTATSMVYFDLLPMQAATLDAYPTGTVQHPPA